MKKANLLKETKQSRCVSRLSKVRLDMMVEFHICPVRGHNFNGNVERKIHQKEESLHKPWLLRHELASKMRYFVVAQMS